MVAPPPPAPAAKTGVESVAGSAGLESIIVPSGGGLGEAALPRQPGGL